MDKEHVKGAADKAKGAIKDAAGKVTGDKELQAEGKMDKAKGAAHNAVSDAKDAVRNATKQLRRVGTAFAQFDGCSESYGKLGRPFRRPSF
jgi:uncharacterized protein YjbJ (UPF0337 family)